MMNNIFEVNRIMPNVYYKVNEIFEIYPEKNMVVGDRNFSHTYEYLILASGREADYSHVEGIIELK